MRNVPWSYPFRSLLARWQASLFSALGISMTVAVLCGVFALKNGFEHVTGETGQTDIVVYLRPGATSEGESGMPRSKVERYKHTREEIALDEQGRPLAAGECYLALFLARRDGTGDLNVPIRGVEEASFEIQGCGLGETLVVNVTPFRVVGVFEQPGAYRSEIWGDVDRIMAALDRPVFQRVVAKLKPGVDLALVAKALENDRELPSKVQSEQAYFRAQTNVLGGVLSVLGVLLTSILGIAAALGAMNTMIAAVGARTREIGILRSIGYGGPAILVAFLAEAMLIGLAGGVLGCLIVLPLDGLETGTMNWNTFTESAFAFRVDAPLLVLAVAVSVGLGLLGGLVPSWRASRLRPVDAFRRQ